MGKHSDVPGGQAAHLVEEGGDAAALVLEALALCSREVKPVFKPVLQVRVADGFPGLHFPLTEVHLFEAAVGDGVGVAAIGGKPPAAGEGTGIDPVEVHAREVLLHMAGFFGERRSEGYVAPAVTGAGGHVHARMADKGDFHSWQAIRVPI